MPSVRIQISLSGEEDGDKVKKGPHSATKKVHGGKQYERSKLMEALMYEITKQTKGKAPWFILSRFLNAKLAHVFVSFYF